MNRVRFEPVLLLFLYKMQKSPNRLECLFGVPEPASVDAGCQVLILTPNDSRQLSLNG